MTECPQCGTINEDNIKNCQGCRINMYWAFQHYEELAAIRKKNQLAPRPETTPFLVETSKRIDSGPTVAWLRNTIKSLVLKVQVKRSLRYQSKDIRSRRYMKALIIIP